MMTGLISLNEHTKSILSSKVRSGSGLVTENVRSIIERFATGGLAIKLTLSLISVMT